jgi:hypothetical protein
MLKPLGMAKCPMVINAISLFAIKPFVNSLTVFNYRRHVSSEQICQVLQAHDEGSSLCRINRTTKLAYNTVVSSVRATSQKAQLIYNEVEAVETEEVSADEMQSFVGKNRSNTHSRNETGETVGLV